MPWYAGNYYTSQYQREQNALMVWSFFEQYGWTKNAVAAMLGNMEVESSINPGIWEGLNDDPEAYYEEHGRYPGYGLVQWTPYTKYADWAGELWKNNGGMQCARIQYEMEVGIQFAWPTMTFRQFSRSRKDPRKLAEIFELGYERHAGDPQPIRKTHAWKWFHFLGGAYFPLELIDTKRRSKPYV